MMEKKMQHNTRERCGREEMQKMLRSLTGELPDEERKRQQIQRLLIGFETNPPVRRVSLAEKLWVQAGFISKTTWLAQLLLLLVAVGLFMQTKESCIIMNLLTAAVVAPLFGLIGCVEVAKSFSREMWELEDACRYPLKYVMSMRMAILGLGDMLIFVLFILFHAGEGIPVFTMAAFLLVPFHLANTVYLLMLMKSGGRCPSWALASAGILMALLFFYAGGGILERAIAGAAGELAGIPELIGAEAAAGLMLLTLCAMLTAALLFIKRNLWEVQSVWN